MGKKANGTSERRVPYREPMSQYRTPRVVFASAPTMMMNEVAAGIAEGTRAALDAEIFPVARALGHFLARMTPDDVVHDIIRSMEAEPDR